MEGSETLDKSLEKVPLQPSRIIKEPIRCCASRKCIGRHQLDESTVFRRPRSKTWALLRAPGQAGCLLPVREVSRQAETPCSTLYVDSTRNFASLSLRTPSPEMQSTEVSSPQFSPFPCDPENDSHARSSRKAVVSYSYRRSCRLGRALVHTLGSPRETCTSSLSQSNPSGISPIRSGGTQPQRLESCSHTAAVRSKKPFIPSLATSSGLSGSVVSSSGYDPGQFSSPECKGLTLRSTRSSATTERETRKSREKSDTQSGTEHTVAHRLFPSDMNGVESPIKVKSTDGESSAITLHCAQSKRELLVVGKEVASVAHHSKISNLFLDTTSHEDDTEVPGQSDLSLCTNFVKELVDTFGEKTQPEEKIVENSPSQKSLKTVITTQQGCESAEYSFSDCRDTVRPLEARSIGGSSAASKNWRDISLEPNLNSSSLHTTYPLPDSFSLALRHHMWNTLAIIPCGAHVYFTAFSHLLTLMRDVRWLAVNCPRGISNALTRATNGVIFLTVKCASSEVWKDVMSRVCHVSDAHSRHTLFRTEHYVISVLGWNLRPRTLLSSYEVVRDRYLETRCFHSPLQCKASLRSNEVSSVPQDLSTAIEDRDAACEETSNESGERTVESIKLCPCHTAKETICEADWMRIFILSETVMAFCPHSILMHDIDGGYERLLQVSAETFSNVMLHKEGFADRVQDNFTLESYTLHGVTKLCLVFLQILTGQRMDHSILNHESTMPVSLASSETKLSMDHFESMASHSICVGGLSMHDFPSLMSWLFKELKVCLAFPPTRNVQSAASISPGRESGSAASPLTCRTVHSPMHSAQPQDVDPLNNEITKPVTRLNETQFQTPPLRAQVANNIQVGLHAEYPMPVCITWLSFCQYAAVSWMDATRVASQTKRSSTVCP